MDRAPQFQEQRVFFATGRREAGALEAPDGLVPAAFATCRDPSRLRHDFPLVLCADDKGPGPITPLTALVDAALRELAPRGMAGERLRRHALRLEREIRTRADEGERGTLSTLWEAAAAKLAASGGDEAVDAAEVLRYTRTALAHDGEVVACDADMPARLLAHAWQVAHDARARAFRKRIDALQARLEDILRAAFVHSEAGLAAPALRAALARPGSDEFDFEAMSRLLARRAPRDELPPRRRARIEAALAGLRAQRFFADPRAAPGDAPAPHGFRFDDCASAAAAFRERLPELVRTVKAIAIAELEADGRYVEALHDDPFEGYGEASLAAGDLALFPDYLVCVRRGQRGAPENANLLEMLSSGLPVKVLVEADDALEEAAPGAGRYAFGVRANRLAMTATSLGGVFVLQSAATNLPALLARIEAGLAHRGPALYSVFAGVAAPAPGVAPYLGAAAAMPSRAFPAFSYDPYAGDDLASRFSFENNPAPEGDWPVAPLEYGDEHLQRVTEEPAFTFADFALCDRRFDAHFARVPRERWNAAMVPIAEWLRLDAAAAALAVPCVLAVDASDVLHRVLVDERLAAATRRCLVLWHRLQEMGGIHNSHAERLLAREKARWESEQASLAAAAALAEAAAPAQGPTTAQAPSPTQAASPMQAAAPATVEAAAAPPPQPERPPGQPWIETSRCPSCNECQLINDKLFLYNENKQAFLGELAAGTYRQMVEAAESCQVSIIHPGQPWNPAEPGLEELIERARPFQ